MTSLTRRFLRAATIVCLALCAAPAPADIQIFPIGPLNPRIPNIAPQPSTRPAWILPFETTFTYALDPVLRFPQGGQISLLVRDNGRREEKKLLTLQDGNLSFTVRVTAAAKGRDLQVLLTDGTKSLQALRLQRPATETWSRFDIRWDGNGLTVAQDGRAFALPAFPRPFQPHQLTLATWHVADLHLKGDGQLDLDWSAGYAGKAEAGGNATGILRRLLGFDTHVISTEPQRRECPTIQIINAGPQEQRQTLRFRLSNEIAGTSQSWQQTVVVPARGQVVQPVVFPTPLATDVYHLQVSSDSDTAPEVRHFMYVQRRNEPAGPGKFGLHDSGTKAFGFWPDALPVDLAHIYLTWAYVQGPPWIKDFVGSWGIDPALPPDQWNWNAKLDWLIGEGHRAYVCLGSTPFQDWQCGKRYPEGQMKQYGWGWRGGTPDDARYRRFLQAVTQRYRGKVWAYEIENEPNTDHGLHADDYVAVARDVYEEVKQNDPPAQVFGICGTSLFVDWMRKTFVAGAGHYMDGVSWHTYVTPSTPEEANLGGLLADANKAIEATGRKMPVLNSETGTFVAPREEVDRAISDQRLAELIDKGVQPLVVPKGWPSRALSERAGAISMVTNAITNFLAGADRFVLFGWNPDWPTKDRWWNVPFDDSNFGMFAVAKDGQRTPSLFTLSAGVLMCQLESADHHRATPVRDYQTRGALFPKTSGSVAVLWSTLGRQTALVQTSQATLQLVSLFGQPSISRGQAYAANTFLHTVDVTEEPQYIHDSTTQLAILPTIIQSASVQPLPDGAIHLLLTIQNPFVSSWSGRLIPRPTDWFSAPAEQSFSLQPHQCVQVTFDLTVKPGTPHGHYPLSFACTLPDGRPATVSADIAVAPTVTIPRIAAPASLAALRQSVPGTPLLLNRPEQVVAGRSPAMTSLQEKQYWSGADELSGHVKTACDGRSLYLLIDVRDAYASLPKSWPGVDGSAIELFLDTRPADKGLGSPSYSKQVWQLVIRPSLQAGQPTAIWKASSASPDLPGLRVDGGPSDVGHYWVAVQIPLADLGISSPRPIGFDIGIDGAREETGGRKSQIMLFGTANNNRDASRFALGFLPTKE
jgi:hypothetical protein